MDPQAPGEQLVLRHSGEVINLADARACAIALHQVRTLEGQLREAKTLLTEAISAECTRVGKKTLDLGDLRAELKTGSETVWDIETLEQLRTLGLPEDRYDELVTVEISYKVNSAVAKQLAGANEQYAAVIEAARTQIEKPSYVSLRAQRAVV